MICTYDKQNQKIHSCNNTRPPPTQQNTTPTQQGFSVFLCHACVGRHPFLPPEELDSRLHGNDRINGTFEKPYPAQQKSFQSTKSLINLVTNKKSPPHNAEGFPLSVHYHYGVTTNVSSAFTNTSTSVSLTTYASIKMMKFGSSGSNASIWKN